MKDRTGDIRKFVIDLVNCDVKSLDEAAERIRLEAEYDRVWNTQELTDEFMVHSFSAPFVYVTRKADGEQGVMMFQHEPRFYFFFKTIDEVAALFKNV